MATERNALAFWRDRILVLDPTRRVYFFERRIQRRAPRMVTAADTGSGDRSRSASSSASRVVAQSPQSRLPVEVATDPAARELPHCSQQLPGGCPAR